jgi:hypothetical protein
MLMGNGIADVRDLSWNEEYFNFTTPYYQKNDQYPIGPQITFTSDPMDENGNISNIKISASLEPAEVYGIAFELDYEY